LLFANKFNEEEKGKKCEIGHMGKIQNLYKKHSPKQKRKKKEKKDRRRHIDVTSVAIVLRSTTVF